MQGSLPVHFEAVVRTFLTCAAYQGDRQFFRQNFPVRFAPRDEALGVTMSVICREHAFEVGLLGTESARLKMARIRPNLSTLSFAEYPDALGEQMNLIAG